MTKTLSLLAVAAITLLSAARGSAQTEAAAPMDGGAIEVGLRAGYGLPFGHTGRTATDTSDDKLSGSIKGEIPFWLDVGYRINPQMYVGLSFQYAIGLTTSSFCGATESCSISDSRLGANFIYHLAPHQSVDPWLGIGIGYEWLKTAASAPNVNASSTGSAFEFANLQAGADFELSPNFNLGPFVSFSAGEYRSVTYSGLPLPNADITDKSLHEWLLFGARGAFDFRI